MLDQGITLHECLGVLHGSGLKEQHAAGTMAVLPLAIAPVATGGLVSTGLKPAQPGEMLRHHRIEAGLIHDSLLKLHEPGQRVFSSAAGPS
jgi:hypothetical protein